MSKIHLKILDKQLIYFKDLEITPIEFINESYSEDHIKSTLEQYVEQYLKRLL